MKGYRTMENILPKYTFDYFDKKSIEFKKKNFYLSFLYIFLLFLGALFADIGNYFMQLAAYAVMWEERTGMAVNNTRIVMDVDNFHPVMYKETRDDWIDLMIKTRDEYNRRKKFHS